MIKYIVLFVTFIIAALGVLQNYLFPDGVSLDYVILAIALLIILFGYQTINTYQENKQSQYLQYSGEITGTNIEIPALKIGTARFIPNNLSDPVFDIDGDPIRVWIEDGKLQLHAIIRNRNGDIVATIFGNQFRVNPETIFDYNYDRNAIEVIDEYGDVILQVQMEEDGVLFCGKFYRKDGSRVAIGNNYIEVRPAGVSIELSFSPIFRYLGKDNLGKRLSN